MNKHQVSAEFFSEEEVRSNHSLLPRLLRNVFYAFRATNGDFSQGWWRFFREKQGLRQKDLSGKINGIRKSVSDDERITVKLFERVMMIMGFRIIALKVVVRHDRTGQVHEFSTEDTIESLAAIRDAEEPIGISSL